MDEDIYQPAGDNNRQIISDHSYLNLSECFAPHINSAALATAKVLSKIKNLQANLKLKQDSLTNKQWPPHIHNKIRSLAEDVKEHKAIELISKEISDINEKLNIIAPETAKIKRQLWELISQAYSSICDDGNHLNSQKAILRRAFNQRLLHHFTTFTANIKQQEEAKKKKEASKPQNMAMDQQPPDAVVDKHIDAMIQKAVKTALNQRQKSKPKKSKPRVSFNDQKPEKDKGKKVKGSSKPHPNQKNGKDKNGGKRNGNSKRDF